MKLGENVMITEYGDNSSGRAFGKLIDAYGGQLAVRIADTKRVVWVDPENVKSLETNSDSGKWEKTESGKELKKAVDATGPAVDNEFYGTDDVFVLITRPVRRRPYNPIDFIEKGFFGF